MKVQFCINNYFEERTEVIAEFEVSKAPTGEQVSAIYDDIKAAMDNYDGEDGFDYEQACLDAAYQHLEILDNPVVFTFYV